MVFFRVEVAGFIRLADGCLQRMADRLTALQPQSAYATLGEPSLPAAVRSYAPGTKLVYAVQGFAD